MAFLDVSAISKYENGNLVVDDLSFSLAPFQKLAIAGETGSGKTSVLKMIAGLMQPDAGEIIFEDKRVKGPWEKLLPGHPQIAYLSQYFELRNNYFVHEILEYANHLSQPDADNIFSVCQIAHLSGRRTDQLSGGEKQRIALAKLLISSPKLLLLDEPFSNLDIIHRNSMEQVIKDIGNKLQISCIMVSHDAEDVLAWADTIIILRNGRIIQQAAPTEIYRHPADEYCAALFGEYNLVKTTGDRMLFLRPEDIIISTGQYGDHKGLVRSIHFHGGYSIADVETANQLFKVLVSDKRIKPGEMVYLALSSESPWYI
jgi:iron(III) transport system ATP-binding protein